MDYAVAIDNWSLFGGPKDAFLNNMRELQDKFEFFDHDCFTIDKSLFKHKFNTYFYDGDHSEISQEKALTYYYDTLADIFIYVCDDWDFKWVASGTRSGIMKCGLKIVKEWILPSNILNNANGWWNGLYIGIMEK